LRRGVPVTPIAVGVAAGGLFLAGALRSPVLGLGLLIGMLCCVLVVSYPGIGMGLLTFLIPLERLQRFTSDTATFTISVMRILAIMCLGALLIHRILQKRSFRLDKTMFLYGGYVGLQMLGMLHTTDPEGTKRAIGTILANCLFFFLYFNYFEKRGQIKLAIIIWLAANLVGAAYSTYDWHFGSGREGGVKSEVDPGEGAQSAENRWSTVWQDQAEWDTLGGKSARRSMGPTSHAAVYGINLIMTIPFFFMFLKRSRGFWPRAGIYACLGLVAYNVLLTNTRAVMLMAAGTVGLCMLYGLFKLKPIHLAVMLAAGIAAVPLLPKDILNRVLDPKNYSKEKSAAMRVRFGYWVAGLHVISENLWLGVGAGNSKEIPKYTKDLAAEETTVHNIFIQIALESGIVGWLFFFSFVGALFYQARKAAEWLKGRAEWAEEHEILVAIQVAMISVLIFGLQVDVFDFPLKGWWLMATITLVYFGWAHKLRREALKAEAEQIVPQANFCPA
jgi:hypothetical protein